MNPERWKRLVFPGPRQVVLEEEEELPEPTAGEILVRNELSMISPGTELALYTGSHVGFHDPEIPWAQYPLYPGYAAVGRVVKGGGEDIEAGELLLHFTPHASHSFLKPERDLFFHLPSGLKPSHVLAVRFGQIAYTAFAAARQKPKNVLVLGAGLVGNLAAQVFREKAEGEVIIADLIQERLRIARECGLPKGVDSTKEELGRQIGTITGGQGVDTVVEATGVPALIVQSLELVNPLGEVILLGSPRGTLNLNVYKLIHRKNTVLTGAHESRFPLRKSEGISPSREGIIEELIDLIVRKRIAVQPLITHVLRPEQAGQAYERLQDKRDQYLGVILEWHRSPG